MLWVTRELVHFDRLISPWLIKRFVDKEAEFAFVQWGREEERPGDAIPFAIPGVELSDHDAEGSTFHKIRIKYRLDDPALVQMDRLVTQGVEHVLHDKAPDLSVPSGAAMFGALAMAEGLMMTSRNDHEAIERAMPLFDALYAVFAGDILMERRGEARAPERVSPQLWRTVFFSAVSMYFRATGKQPQADTDIDEDFERTLKGVRRIFNKSGEG